jgi:hypothetical protein
MAVVYGLVTNSQVRVLHPRNGSDTHVETCRSKALTTIDLSNQPIGLSMMGPLADILLLDFGLRSLHLSNCGLEDEVSVRNELAGV